jgi:hypothetical protein
MRFAGVFESRMRLYSCGLKQPAAKSAFESIRARQSPNVPAMISIAAGNEEITTPTHAKSFSPDVSESFPEPATEYARAGIAAP